MFGRSLVKFSIPSEEAAPPALLRSLYRRLLKETHQLDTQPLAKTLFPIPTELHTLLGVESLYTPDGVKYTDVLRRTFRAGKARPDLKLGFDTLHRLRAHRDNLQDRLPSIKKNALGVRSALQRAKAAEFRAAKVTVPPWKDRCVVPFVMPRSTEMTNLVLDSAAAELDGSLAVGTVLLAHPLSSAHVDRRVMLVTERSPLATSAVVLDLRFTYPLSHGNPMFPEVFWGHEVHDGGYSQIGFTMPPTAQITILHTLEPIQKDPSMSGDEADAERRGSSGPEKESLHPSAERKQHDILCRPLIRGESLDNGEVESTLYLSKVEALPYLADLVPGAPRSSVRVCWGSMRWPSAQLDAEVRHGHWIPAKVSSSFFQSSDLGAAGSRTRHFPTRDELREAKRLRVKHYGADVALPQTFPPDQTLRQRDALWDAILYAMGGEHRELIGCYNPFAGHTRWAVPHIIAPALPALPPSESERQNAEAEDNADLVVVGKAISTAASGDAGKQDDVTAAPEETNGTPSPDPVRKDTESAPATASKTTSDKETQ